jgi:Uma2 family endonuclease
LSRGAAVFFSEGLDTMSTIARLTVAEYDRMVNAGVFDQGRRVEFIEGKIREMSPIGPEHEFAVDELNERSVLSVVGKGVRVRIQETLGLPKLESVPQPDVSWVRRETRQKPARPEAEDVFLVVEVADTSLGYDLGEKANLYAAAGIRDYWVADCVNGRVVVHREPSPSGYGDVKSLSGNQSISPLSHPEVVFQPESFFRPTGS